MNKTHQKSKKLLLRTATYLLIEFTKMDDFNHKNHVGKGCVFDRPIDFTQHCRWWSHAAKILLPNYYRFQQHIYIGSQIGNILKEQTKKEKPQKEKDERVIKIHPKFLMRKKTRKPSLARKPS